MLWWKHGRYLVRYEKDCSGVLLKVTQRPSLTERKPIDINSRCTQHGAWTINTLCGSRFRNITCITQFSSASWLWYDSHSLLDITSANYKSYISFYKGSAQVWLWLAYHCATHINTNYSCCLHIAVKYLAAKLRLNCSVDSLHHPYRTDWQGKEFTRGDDSYCSWIILMLDYVSSTCSVIRQV